MIVKFDHIAFSCRRTEIDEYLKKFSSYKQVFCEKGLPNIEAKKILLGNDAYNHDIFLLEHTKDGVSVEITAYDEVSGKAKYDLAGQTVFVPTNNLTASINFYLGIGFKLSSDNILSLRTLLDKSELCVKLQDSLFEDNYALDNQGFCALAFITNNAKCEKKQLEVKDIKTTAINQLTVHGKDLQIFFAYNEYGDIVEFIEPSNRKVSL